MFAKNAKYKKIFVFLPKLIIMKYLSKLFFEKIKNNCDKNISFIDEVAAVLDINYDAAYRRINNKTTLSLEDAIKLANHFNISLDIFLKKNLSENKIIVKDSKNISSFTEIESYYKNILNNIIPFKSRGDVHITYSARDIPLFYFNRDELFSKFKIFTTLYLTNKDFPRKNIHFNVFNPPASLLHAAKQFGDIYYNFDITEIWNDNILDSTINQILYFYEIQLISYSTAIKLCNKLVKIIKQVEIDSFSSIRNNKFKSKFYLYNSISLMLNNNVIITSKNKKVALSQYALGKHFIIEDQNFIKQYEVFINNSIELATLLSKTGIKERLLFFKPKYRAIEKAKQRIELIRQFPI